jgi:hypothetical protein
MSLAELMRGFDLDPMLAEELGKPGIRQPI